MTLPPLISARLDLRPMVFRPCAVSNVHSLWNQAGTAGVASGFLCQRATSRTAGLVPSLAEIESMKKEVCEEVHQHPHARQLLTHPGVGPITALATEVFPGNPLRITDGKALGSYIGMIPSEHSSGVRQRLGAMSEQGNAFLRYLWCETAMHAPSRIQS